jgi:hypothetical protein
MSSITKGRSLFDTAAPADSDNIGAYLRASDGTLIDTVSIGGVDRLAVDATLKDGSGNALTSTSGALNVSLANAGTLAVSAVDFDIRDLTHVSDSVKVGDGTDFLAVNGDGSINVTFAGTASVSGVDFDIRDLTHVSDSVKVGDGTDFIAVNTDGSLNTLTAGTIADDAADSGNPLKIGSRAVTGVLATVAHNDRADALSDQYRRMYVNDSAQVSLLSSTKTANTSASLVVASALAGRRRIIVHNIGGNVCYLGHSGVTSSNGLKLDREASVELDLGQYVDLYVITASSTTELRVLEIA